MTESARVLSEFMCVCESVWLTHHSSWLSVCVCGEAVVAHG